MPIDAISGPEFGVIAICLFLLVVAALEITGSILRR